MGVRVEGALADDRRRWGWAAGRPAAAGVSGEAERGGRAARGNLRIQCGGGHPATHTAGLQVVGGGGVWRPTDAGVDPRRATCKRVPPRHPLLTRLADRPAWRTGPRGVLRVVSGGSVALVAAPRGPPCLQKWGGLGRVSVAEPPTKRVWGGVGEKPRGKTSKNKQLDTSSAAVGCCTHQPRSDGLFESLWRGPSRRHAARLLDHPAGPAALGTGQHPWAAATRCRTPPINRSEAP